MEYAVAPGIVFYKYLDSIYENKPLKIIETGCMRDLTPNSEFSDGWSTLYIARWIKNHKGCEFHSVDLDINALDLAHLALEVEGLAQYCEFHCQDSIKYLSNITWADFIFLDSCDGLQHGLDEFRLAASTGARIILMDDYQTKAAWAVAEGKKLGWDVQQVNRYSIFQRKS